MSEPNNNSKVPAKIEPLFTKIDKQIIQDSLDLLNELPFFGSILSSLNRTFTNKIPTMCVGWDPSVHQWKFLINPDFYQNGHHDDKGNPQPTSPEQRRALLMHEAWHAALLHPTRFMDVIPGLDLEELKNVNIAADALVNHQIPKLEALWPHACTLNSLGIPYSDDLTMERLYALMKQKQQQEEKQKGKGKSDKKLKALDSHPWDEDSSGEDDEDKDGDEKNKQGGGKNKDGQNNEDREKTPKLTPKDIEEALGELRQMVETAMNSNPESFGSLPEEIQRQIRSGLRPRVRWANELRIFGQTAVKISRKFTMKRPSRRYGYPSQGRTKKHGGFALVGVDVSGSTEQWQNQFAAELQTLTRYCRIDVVPFDTRVVEIKKHWRSGMTFGSTCGGTDPQCVFDYAKQSKEKPDIIVILTDGQHDNVNVYDFKTLFVITPDGEMRKEARCIRMDP